jgi:hypothetical protein
MKATSNNSEGGFATPRPEVAATQSGCHPWMEWVLLIVLAIAWGAAYPLIRVAVTTIGPLTLISARSMVAAIALLFVAAARGISLCAPWAEWRRFLFQALLNNVIPWTLLAWGARYVDNGPDRLMKQHAVLSHH